MDFQSQVISFLGEIIIKETQSQGHTQKDILYLLRQHKPKEFTVEEDNFVFFEGMKFGFENVRLSIMLNRLSAS